jgi:hypothetical protein
MFKNKFKDRLSLLLIPVTIVIIYLGWKKWSLTIPQPLPQQSDVSVIQDNRILDGTYYQISIPPTKYDAFLSAEYRLWLPADVKKIRGLVVKQHGCGDPAATTGLNHADDLQWQTLALKHQFALIGTKLPTGDKSCDSWAMINNGSGKAFFQALNLFAQKSKHPELEQVPWLLWGHSGGGDWVVQMLQQYSERTIAAFAARGGGFTLLGTNPTLAGTPILFALGEKDMILPYETQTLPKEVFARYRKINSAWAIASEANTTHETSDTRLLAIPYFDAIATARMTKDSNKLRPVDLSPGWLGNTITHEIAPVNRYKDKSLEAAWLPNEDTARKWQQYVKTGKISPTRKPNQPTNVNVQNINSKEVLITWNFIPDLENGLPSFRIYRNNSLIKTLQGQGHDFGDAASPPNLVLEFLDNKATPNSVYKIAAFNQLGESISQPKQLLKQKSMQQ